ncbi:2-amino-4-hydroxy-6-hydroxymethyldihydropteridine diphosphokinase [Candidatus Peregrinibacteria bacterium]|nr:MAG: 2-amino-4-hydroxy-6-hydroxymethyldihydropteridine diphosphokinase [Candidatus Peregrinibacteria bacterium]
MHVFLGLGTNLGDREANLVLARDLLMKHDVLVMGQSNVLETQPLGGLDQPLYLNQVVECQTELSPQELLKACKTVEAEMGRPKEEGRAGNVQLGFAKKTDLRWQSRIIDIDILFYGNWIVKEPELEIPHYGMAERAFVLQGLCELAPEFVHPVLKKPLKALLSDA